jgi:glucose-6-phosphate isomerase, archaeal
MRNDKTADVDVIFDGNSLSGEPITTMTRRIREMAGFFADQNALTATNGDTVVYSVDSYTPVTSGLEGGLFFGVTHIQPGTVGDEYYMTKGHFHTVRNRGEYYWGISGEGILVLMAEDRTGWVERVKPGTLHYIPGHTAHRLVNTGSTVLDVGACWPADAGHEYGSIADSGFSIRIVSSNGTPAVVSD